MELRIKKVVLTSCHRFKGKTIVMQVESSFMEIINAFVQETTVKLNIETRVTPPIEWLVCKFSIK